MPLSESKKNNLNFNVKLSLVGTELRTENNILLSRLLNVKLPWRFQISLELFWYSGLILTLSSEYSFWCSDIIGFQSLLTFHLIYNCRNLVWLGCSIIKRNGPFKLNKGQNETVLGNVLVSEILLRDMDRLEVCKLWEGTQLRAPLEDSCVGHNGHSWTHHGK